MFQRSSKTSSQALRAALIENEAVKLRLLGYNYEVIAQKLSEQFKAPIPTSLAAKAVKRAIARAKQETSETLKESREIASLQLDELFYHAFAHVRAGDRQAIADVIKVMDRKARLLGLDAPTKVEQTTNQPTTQLTHLTEDQLKAIESAIEASSKLTEVDDDGFVNLDESVEYPEN